MIAILNYLFHYNFLLSFYLLFARITEKYR
jgi:hypothetical protein